MISNEYLNLFTVSKYLLNFPYLMNSKVENPLSTGATWRLYPLSPGQ